MPWTLLGLALALVALACGARLQRRAGIWEAYGGALAAGLARLPGVPCMGAITLGHVILAANATSLSALRAHEQVHVRQYERWGPLFVPAYLLAGAWAWLRGGRAYRDNPFECAAYRAGPFADAAQRAVPAPTVLTAPNATMATMATMATAATAATAAAKATTPAATRAAAAVASRASAATAAAALRPSAS